MVLAPPPSARWMEGPATFTIVASSRSMVLAASTTAATIQRIRESCVPAVEPAAVAVSMMAFWLAVAATHIKELDTAFVTNNVRYVHCTYGTGLRSISTTSPAGQNREV